MSFRCRSKNSSNDRVDASAARADAAAPPRRHGDERKRKMALHGQGQRGKVWASAPDAVGAMRGGPGSSGPGFAPEAGQLLERVLQDAGRADQCANAFVNRDGKAADALVMTVSMVTSC
jgi:hypothetical protein